MSSGADAPLSHQNALIVDSMPAKRENRGLVLLEGRALALDVLAREGAVPECLFVVPDSTDHEVESLAKRRGVRVVPITTRAAEKISATRTPPRVALLTKAPFVSELDPSRAFPRMLVLQGISDPGNAGTLIRAAAAFRFVVAFDGECVSPTNEKLLRATAGVAFIPDFLFHVGRTVPEFLCTSAQVLALDATGSGSLAAALGRKGPQPLVLVVGNESRGVDMERWRGATPVRIPMASTVESLNAAVSGSIAMYEAARSST